MRTLLLLSSFTFLLLAPGVASAQGLVYFMKIDGIVGESQDSVHTDTVDLLPMDFGTEFTVSANGSGVPQTENTQPSSVTVTFAGDLKAFPKILEGSLQKKVYAKVEIFGARRVGSSSGNTDLFTMTLENCRLETVSFGVSSGDVPLTSVTIAWEKLKIETEVIDPETGISNGKITAEYPTSPSA
jgi:type VI protein secretion system component Hcp